MTEVEAPRFFCDAMLGGLARWLRALGYEARFEHGIDDAHLVKRAGDLSAIVLSSDRPLFARRRLQSGEVRALFVPRHAPILDQAFFVLSSLGLRVVAPRCMSCGGALQVVERAEVAQEVPEKSLRAFDEFFRCEGCRRVYWRGTHFERIEKTRAAMTERLDAARTRPTPGA